MKQPTLQQKFFNHIKLKLPANISLVDDVAELLHISIDTAYRRIRGDKSLTFEEIKLLSAHFHVSVDSIMSIESQSTVFYGTWVGPDNFNFEEYLKNILVLTQNLIGGNEKKMYYEAKDFPIYHYFQFPELAAFKYFFWVRTILSYPGLNKVSFEDHDVSGAIQSLGSQVIKTYNEVPSVEIWSVETINSTIRQIEYYRDAGLFRKRESVDIIYDQLAKLIDHIELQAEMGVKFHYGSKPVCTTEFQLYFNDAYLGHNTIMAEKDGARNVFINHGVLNFMMTSDQVFCDNTKLYFENTMKRSALISKTNDKERHRFFKGMQEKITYNRNRILPAGLTLAW
jgi:hypothetical protein